MKNKGSGIGKGDKLHSADYLARKLSCPSPCWAERWYNWQDSDAKKGEKTIKNWLASKIADQKITPKEAVIKAEKSTDK